MVWFGMVCNIALCTPFAIIFYRSEITCDIPILNVVAILSTSGCTVNAASTRKGKKK